MVDLNSLTLYQKKISSYIDNNILDISTKSNILSMFKIKNYTGNGIKINGNVKIDENGIATLFTNPTDYIKTNLKALDVMNSTEFQIKFKTAHKLNRLVSSLTPRGAGSVIRVNCLATSALGNGLVYDCNPSSSDETFTYFFKTPFDIAKYYNIVLANLSDGKMNSQIVGHMEPTEGALIEDYVTLTGAQMKSKLSSLKNIAVSEAIKHAPKAPVLNPDLVHQAETETADFSL